MDLTEVMNRLETLGTANYRKVLPRHGVRGPLFGVKYADLYKLQKKLAGEQDLALELWDTGNHDARVLATLVADPARCTSKQLDAWVKDATNPLLSDAVATLTAKTPHAQKKADAWTKVKAEWKSATGWVVVGALAAPGAADDAWLADKLAKIEAGIDAAANRTRHCMNQTLIAIGGYRAALRKDAVAAAQRIGRVEVDHGDTSCKTPAAVPYIKKIAARAAAKKKTAARKKKKRTRAPMSSRRAR